jgi:hypothetical protein
MPIYAGQARQHGGFMFCHRAQYLYFKPLTEETGNALTSSPQTDFRRNLVYLAGFFNTDLDRDGVQNLGVR